MRFFSILTLATVSASVAGAQSAVDRAIDKASAAYANAKTARATFEQTITNPLTGTVVTSKGEFQQRQPNRFSFRFTDPKGDMIVADGRALWVYLPSTNPGQVIKMPIGAEGAGSLDLMSQFFKSPRTRFNITDAGAATVGGRATRALILQPKTGAGNFSRAKIWIDDVDGTLRQFETTEQSGLKRLVTVSKISLNSPVQAKAFTFILPKGVKVFDQEALAGGR